MNKMFTSKFIFVFSFLVSALTVSRAQITLQNVNLPNVGDVWINKMIMDTTIQPGSGGTGVIWDFSNYVVTPNTISEEFKSPLSSGNDASFTGSNLKVTSFFGWTDYYIKNGAGNELQYLGFFSPSNELRITSVEKVFSVPFTYNSSISNVPVAGTGYMGAAVTGTISVVSDGYGTLKIQPGQGGPYNNVLRVKYDINLIEDLGGMITTVHVVRYAWYRSGLRAPLFQISSLDMSGVIGNMHQKLITLSTVTSGVNDLNKPNLNLTVFPNPAKSMTTISYTSDRSSSEASLKVMDITGRIWKTENVNQLAGEHYFNVDVSDLPKGIYIVALSAGTVVRQQRLIVE